MFPGELFWDFFKGNGIQGILSFTKLDMICKAAYMVPRKESTDKGTNYCFRK